MRKDSIKRRRKESDKEKTEKKKVRTQFVCVCFKAQAKKSEYKGQRQRNQKWASCNGSVLFQNTSWEISFYQYQQEKKKAQEP